METRSKKRPAEAAPDAPPPQAKRTSRRSSSKQPAANPSKDPDPAPQTNAGPSSAPPQPAQRGRRSTRSSTARAATAQAPAGEDTVPKPEEAPAQEAPAAEAPNAADTDKPAAPEERDAGMAGRRGEDRDDDMERNLNSANSALQGLLRKLGAGFDEALLSSMTGMSGGRFKNIIQDLRQADDEGSQLGALTELCELLAISSEDTLTSFPVESAVPLLVQSLNAEHNPDVMLLAARALTFLADMLPSSCSSIVRHGAVASFCQRLLTIEYIDLAEQSLLALEKLSHEHAHSLLQNGGLLAVLSYLDFFPTGVQRVAVGTAANMCRGLTSENASAVKEAVPILTNLLQYQDAKVVDNACLALSHIADSYASKPNLLAMLSSGGLIKQALHLVAQTVSGNATQLSLTTHYSLIKLMCTCAAKSPSVAEQLLQGKLLDTLHTLIATSSLLPSANQANGTPALWSVEQLAEVLSLLSELLPPIPNPYTVVSDNQPLDTLLASPAAKDDARMQYFTSHPAEAVAAVSKLAPLMIQLHSATVMPHVRQQCLNVLLRLLTMATPQQLSTALRNVRISSFVANLLGLRDSHTQAVAVLLAEVLMAKLPSVFKNQFLKEGVLQALRTVINKGQAASGAAAAVATPPAGGSGDAAAPATAVNEASAAAAAGNAEAGGSAEASNKRVTRSNSRMRDSNGGTSTGAPSGSGRAASPPTGRRTSTAGTAAAAAAAAPAAPASAPAAGSAVPAAVRNPFGMAAGPDGAARTTAAPATAGAAVMATAPSVLFAGKLSVRASAFCSQHFGEQGAVVETEGIKQLKAACKELCTNPDAVQKLLDLLSESSSTQTIGDVSVLVPGESTDTTNVQDNNGAQEEDGISVFELVNSGVVRAMIDYLKGSDLQQGPSQDAALLARVRAFVRVALAADSGTHPPLAAVLRKLQASLASVESFPVIISRAAAGSASVAGGRASASSSAAGQGALGSYRSGLAALARPFKLRLCRHSTEKQLKDYGANVVLIEPLASMQTIEDFLYPRVSGSTPSPAPGAGASAGGEAAGGSGGAGKSSSQAPAEGARERSKSLEPGAAAAGGSAGGAMSAQAGGAGARSSSVPIPQAASKAQPVPEASGSRRMTRAAARAAAAAAGQSVEDHEPPAQEADEDEDEDEDVHMDTAEDEDDHPMEEGDMGGGAMFDDDGDYDEELDGEDDQDMDIPPMQVHDLHVDDVMGGTASGQPPATRQASAPAGSTAATAAQPAASRLPTAASANPPSAIAAAARAAAEAAAAAAGIRPPSAWGAAARAGAGAAGAAGSDVPAAVRAEQPRIVFYSSGGQPLPSSATVFQAIQQQPAAGSSATDGGDGSEEGGSSRLMWDSVHTLYYRTASTDDAVPATAREGTPAGPSGSEGSPAAGAQRGSRSPGLAAAAAASNLPLGAVMPLQQIRGVSVSPELPAEAACRDLMELIKLLEVVNRLGARLAVSAEEEEEAASARTGRMNSNRNRTNSTKAFISVASCGSGILAAAEDRPAYGRVPRSEFVSSRLASKLSQQLKDVLAICGGGLPAWCKHVAFHCKHLVPFEVRRRHFYCTALGLGRALQHMQTLHSVESGGAGVQAGAGSEPQTRVGRLQRQKVRVSRKRILESAIKVMELYASQRMVLELEYFGEVGTGLGPTLEFYTLLSHDLQRRNLKLWRHEDAAQAATTDELAGAKASPVDRMSEDGAAPAAPQGASLPLSSGTQPIKSHVEAWHDDTQYVNAPWGLFPAPLAPNSKSASKVVDTFKLLGRAMAKALQDNRLMDLPLSYAFYRAVLGVPLDMYDIATFDPGLGRQLQKFWTALVAARKTTASSPTPACDAAAAPAPAAGGNKGSRKRSAGGKAAAAATNAASTAPSTAPLSVVVDGVPIEDLCLSFTLPGYPEFELVPGGADKTLDSSNLGQWIDAVVDATLGSGIAQQLDAFKAGFNEVFALSHLEAFYEDEIEAMLCGSGEAWTVAGLAKAMKFDHGYTPASPTIVALLEVLSELDSIDQKRFLRFVTGCPRLPPGGLASLQPRLTVVRKHPSGDRGGGSVTITPVGSLRDTPTGSSISTLADGDLPSVMTCANYIKLPPYSCKQVLKERLLFAIREGQGSFDLS